MEYRILGRTGLRVSSLGLGSGGPSQFGQKSGVPEEEIHRLVRRALESGVNFFDTAAGYGKSEEILGRALRGVPRDRYYMATKFSPRSEKTGRLRGADELRRSLEQSLVRLGVDAVDVFQIHGVRPDEYEQVCDRLLPEADKLRREGKCRFLGVTETYAHDGGHHRMLVRALQDGCFHTVLVGYNLLNPSAEREVLPLCAETNTGVLVMCAVRRVLGRPEELRKLISDVKKRGVIGRDSVPDEEPLGWLLSESVTSVPAAAYKYVHAHPAVSCVLTGTSRVEHFLENLAAVDGPRLPQAHVDRLRGVFGRVEEPLGN